MINQELIKAYKENSKISSLIKYCYKYEMNYKNGVLYNKNLKLKAELNPESRWEALLITDLGLMMVREFDAKYFLFKTISSVGAQDKEFHLDASKSKNLTELKNYFADEPILTSFRSENNGGRTNAELLSFLFHFFRKTLINDYRKRYEFLWQDTGCFSGLDLYHAINII